MKTPFNGMTEESLAIRSKIAVWRIKMQQVGCPRRQRLSQLITGGEKALAEMAAAKWANGGINNIHRFIHKCK